jgi:hypothetical protein
MVKVTTIWRPVWNSDGVIMTGENTSTREKPVSVILCSPQISHTLGTVLIPCGEKGWRLTNWLSHGTALKKLEVAAQTYTHFVAHHIVLLLLLLLLLLFHYTLPLYVTPKAFW